MVFMPPDKRRFPRRKVKLPLRFEFRGESQYNNLITDNLSLGGLGFISDKFIKPSTNLMLELNVLLNILTPVGRVSWSAPLPHSDMYQSGVEFVEIDQSQKRHLEDFLQMQELKD